MTNSPLLDSLLQVIKDYERDYQRKLGEAEETIKRLEQENIELRQQLDSGSSILDDVTDETLRVRLKTCQKAKSRANLQDGQSTASLPD